MEHHIIIHSEEIDLAATLHYPSIETREQEKKHDRWPLIVICHGFIGNRMGVDRLFVKAAREFSSKGFMVLRFDYGGCGESTGDYGSGGLDDLIKQTRSVLDYGLSMDCVDLNRVIVIGHSLGGAAALLTAAKDHRVKTLVLWSPVAHPHNDIVKIIGKEAYLRLESDSYIDYLGYSFTNDFFHSLSKHQPFEQLRKFSGDVLLIHGTADDVIPVDYAPLYQKIFWLRTEGTCDLELIVQADHTYSSRKSTEQLFTKTSDWLLSLAKRKKDWNDWTI